MTRRSSSSSNAPSFPDELRARLASEAPLRLCGTAELGEHHYNVLVEFTPPGRVENLRTSARDEPGVDNGPRTERMPGLPAALAAPIELAIPGDAVRGGTAVTINRDTFGVPDSPFAPLFLLSAEWLLRGANSLVSVPNMGGFVGETFQPIHRLNALLRRQLPALFPEGALIHFNDRHGCYRLDSRVTVVHVNARALLNHTVRRVRELAAQLVEAGIT